MQTLHTSEPPLNGHERRRAATRARVLEAARAILAEGGRESLTVVAVAARAQVSEGTVYKIFANRDDLAAAAMLGVSEPWIDAVAATPSTQHPLRRLLRAHRQIVSALSEEEVLLHTIAAQRPRTTTELGLRFQAQEMLVRSCAAGLTRSPRATLTPDEATLWSQVYVAVLRAAREPGDFTALTRSIDTVIA